jgi:hypothetical protein
MVLVLSGARSPARWLFVAVADLERMSRQSA